MMCSQQQQQPVMAYVMSYNGQMYAINLPQTYTVIPPHAVSLLPTFLYFLLTLINTTYDLYFCYCGLFSPYFNQFNLTNSIFTPLSTCTYNCNWRNFLNVAEYFSVVVIGSSRSLRVVSHTSILLRYVMRKLFYVSVYDYIVFATLWCIG